MKNKFTYLFLFCFLSLSAQENYPVERLYLAEMNTAKNLMSFRSDTSVSDYDVTHYKLELTVDPAVVGLDGVTTTTFTALSPMNSITFQFDDAMTVSSVTRGGNNLSFTQNVNDELIIQFGNTIQTGESSSVKVRYSGDPASSGFGSYEQTHHNFSPVIWTLSEPYGAKTWWPCKQDLSDKADSVDLYITAPKKYTAVSNGIIEGITVSGNEETTHWDHDYPIPAYLVAFSVTNFSKYSTTAGSGSNTFPIVNYVYPEYYNYIKSKTSVTPGIMDFFEDTFGLYPYNDEKYGHCQFGWGGGMEHTTISFMGAFSRSIIAHELAHQWFGDKVTCGTWSDIWLNEGFAAYSEGMVVNHFDGSEAFQNWREGVISNITSRPGGSVYVPPSNLTVNRIFSGRLSYDKGSMVLHMLRSKLGDDVFFQAIKNYLSDPDLAYGFAVTSDLKTHMESASGMDLDEFFKDWIYGEGYPTYKVYWHQNTDNDLTLTFTQTQSHSSVDFFELPVTVQFHGTGSKTFEKTFNNTANQQQFTVNVPFEVVSVEIDPYSDLITGNNSVVLGRDSFSKIDLVLYPNPVEGRLYFEKPASLKINAIKITDLLGRTVKKYNSVESYFIPTSGLRSGVYFVILDTSKGQYHKKIIKK